jgi:5-methylcytosine-specific restriction endonuclease McrA
LKGIEMDAGQIIKDTIKQAKDNGDEVTWSMLWNAASSCDHNAKTPKRRIVSNGVSHYGYQCDDCGKWEVAKKSVFGLNIPTDLYDEHKFNERQSQIVSQIKEAMDQIQESKKEQWFESYNEYLSSNKWKEKRKLVLERDRYICQGCGVAAANQVHHLTYTHVTDELLFQLVSVCQDCHLKIHNKETR